MPIRIQDNPPFQSVYGVTRKPGPPDAMQSAVVMRLVQAANTLSCNRPRLRKWVARVNRQGRYFDGLPDADLRHHVDDLRRRMVAGGCRDHLTVRGFALVREVARRQIGLRPFDCQLMGAYGLFNGRVVEMATGEGKTLTAALAAAIAALAGVPTHVISVNDYLTARDAEAMGPIYRFMGLSVAAVTHAVARQDRRVAYRQDITYCTNKEVAFDYLRDRLALGGIEHALRLQAKLLRGDAMPVDRLILPGLGYAIVDEADSVLIDEARTPLVIAKNRDRFGHRQLLRDALNLARGLKPQVDFTIDTAMRNLTLLPAGKDRIGRVAADHGPLWQGRRRRHELIVQALTALHLFNRDEHYLVSGGRVRILDEFTGRLMGDRSWEKGLHQLIETKEGCPLTPQRETLARASYQRFFRQYRLLAGMTGTAREVRVELAAVYGLPVVRIPAHRACCRRDLPDRIFGSEAAKLAAITDRVRQLHRRGRPVLVGTRTVAASEKLSRRLDRAGIEHRVLNAKQDRAEARIVARAGQGNAVTIATNMAGRGTDIRLGPHVAAFGGLHVILTERHEAARIDRQLAGRCARQGDPGSFEALLSMDDPLVARYRSMFAGRLCCWLLDRQRRSGVWLAKRLMRRAQRQIESRHARIRRALVKQDQRIGELLAFSGKME